MAQKKRSSDGKEAPLATASTAGRAETAGLPAASPARDRAAIGPGLCHLRTQRGLSLSDLADQVGVSATQLGAIEAGRSEPSIDLTWSLANALGVTFSALVSTRAPRATAGSLARTATTASEAAKSSEPARPRPRSLLSRRALIPAAQSQRGRSTEVHELKLAPHGLERAAPQPHGTEETLLVTVGRVIVRCASEELVLGVGDSHVFRGDSERFYLNPDETDAVIYAMVAPA